jgi:hypothetical protein
MCCGESPRLDADSARVLVVEDGTRIVGCTVLMSVLHADCVWIHPDYRTRVSVWRRLWEGIEASTDAVYVAACLPVMQKFLAKVGVRVPGEHFVWVSKQRPSSV